MSIFSTLLKATFVHEGENSLFSFQQKTCQVFTLKDSYCYFLFRMALKRRIDFLLDIDPSQEKQLDMIHSVKNIELVQHNKYETAPHFIQLNQNLTSDCWLI